MIVSLSYFNQASLHVAETATSKGFFLFVFKLHHNFIFMFSHLVGYFWIYVFELDLDLAT